MDKLIRDIMKLLEEKELSNEEKEKLQRRLWILLETMKYMYYITDDSI
ncbi:MAG: hypothetical protein ACOX1S_05545 [Anaerostipes sp.]|jgi:hypothetical protein|nr:hypothetical protein [Anaerostipes sp.]